MPLTLRISSTTMAPMIEPMNPEVWKWVKDTLCPSTSRWRM